MSSAILIVNRAFDSDFDSLYGQVKYLNGKYDQVYFIHTYKTDRVLKKIPIAVHSISINEWMGKIFDEKKYTKWIEFFDDFDIDLDDIDDIWLFGGSLSDGGKLKRKHPNSLDNALEKNSYMFFQSVCKQYFIEYVALKLAKKYDCPIHEVCYDPGEFLLSYVKDERIKPREVNVYHGYVIPHLGIRRLDTFQSYLRNTPISFFSDAPESDFCFGYSYMTKDRAKTNETIQEVLGAIDDKYVKRVFVKSKIEDIDTSINRMSYMEHIHKSKFTLIVPAYEQDCFSIYRFLESVYYGCLPLVHESCNLDGIFDCFGCTLDALVINKDNINEKLAMSEVERLKLVNYYREIMF